MTVACYPGSFDPVTNGHLDIIERAAPLFERLVVVVSVNPSKRTLFDTEERLQMLREAVSSTANVEVASWSGLTVDYCLRVGAKVIVKGLRALSDYEDEIAQAHMNTRMSGVQTALIPTSPEYSYVSSTLMKQVVALGGHIEGLVPDAVAKRLSERLRKD